MLIEKLDFPTPILVIDDFMKPEEAQAILEECWSLAPHYKEAQVVAEGGKNVKKNSLRKNDVVFIDEHYGPKRTFSDIITLLERHIFRDEEKRKIWDKDHTILRAIPLSSRSEIILSRYGNCDFYGWHTDNGISIPCQRVMTVVYYINTEPEKFNGGSLIFKDGDTELKVSPKHNRAVVFPSYLLHRVENVRVESEDVKDFRYSLNCFIGFNG